MELLPEEVAARVADLGEVKEIGSGEEGLDVVLRDLNGARVDERDQLLNG